MAPPTATSSVAHQTVLRDELVTSVLNDTSGAYIDATFGRGGHTRALLARLAPDARVLVLDRDAAALTVAMQLCAEDTRVQAVQARFSELTHVAGLHNFHCVAGIMFDLGVSSPQIDEALRGFSFRFDGPLDMRMDQTRGATAADWLNSATVVDMARVFRDYGEERYAKRIALAIEHARPVTSTQQLVAIIEAAQPRPDRHKHAATRVFQAIRIHINDELDELRAALEQAWSLLAIGGCLGVISFHSLEDRIVKRNFVARSTPPPLPRRLPVTVDQQPLRAAQARRRMRPSLAESQSNPRARSAVLRSIERLR